uniref:Uncharacterized protein n=1 Tax=Monopterus albus TaxID=43700 RepID=A0A3Q3IH13_MONAL
MTFDARQKIGVNDVRQRLGGGTGNILLQSSACLLSGFQVKDAREKLGQTDARFKIRGRGGAGGLQDARQMINSRKQGQNQLSVSAQITQKTAATHQLQSQTLVPQIQINTNNSTGGVKARQFLSNNKRMVDARDRLSLKRSIGGTQTQVATALPLKITKTIQVRLKLIVTGRSCFLTTDLNSHNVGFNTEVQCLFHMKLNLTFSFLCFIQSGSVGLTFSMSAPITKVVKNDTYTAPRPPVPVAPARPSTSVAANRSSAAFTPFALVSIWFCVEFCCVMLTHVCIYICPQELFCVCGALKRARLVKMGVAEVVFVRKEDAVSAYRKYNNRCLDGQPMKCNLHIQGNVITSDQPILLRLSDSPGTGSSTKKDSLPPSLSRPAGQRASSQPTPEVDPQTILKALFKSTAQSTPTTESPSSQATAFRIKI